MTSISHSSIVERRLSVDLPLPVDEALSLAGELAGLWGGELRCEGRGGRLQLPVAAGVRHGVVEAWVDALRLGADGSRLELRLEREAYRVHVSALVVLLIGALGAVFLLVAPLVVGRESVRLLPPAFIVMLAAWFLVASRVRHRSPADFLESLGELARAESGDAQGGAGK
ncbi:MAG TPA: hypothetical protein VMV46_13665 [Thermoanaerobaculia bacterium]|nr:hypothetical protein [Thermoanaerobaculia bacterium]